MFNDKDIYESQKEGCSVVPFWSKIWRTRKRERERVTRVRERESLGHLEINWQSFEIVLKFGFGQFGQ